MTSMEFITNHKLVALGIAVAVGVVLVIVSQVLFIMFNGKFVPTPEIPRGQQTFGSGKELNFVVLGDSTAIGQGADYADGIAVKSAQHLAVDHTVKLTNFGISGAIASEVLSDQVEPAARLKPDIVLLALGANDVTKLSSMDSVNSAIRRIISILRTANPKVKIIMTGSPAVGTVPRFGTPTQWLASTRVKRINVLMDQIARQENVIRLKIAERTGPIFAKDRGLFAEDNFHPNRKGYEVWLPVIYEAL